MDNWPNWHYALLSITAVSARHFRNRPACRKSPRRAFYTPPPATKCPSVPVPVLLRDATLPAPPAAPQYPAAICPLNARAKIARRKTQLPVAEIQIPSRSPRERIGLMLPWRKRSLPKTLPSSSSTLDSRTRFRQRLVVTALALLAKRLSAQRDASPKLPGTPRLA